MTAPGRRARAASGSGELPLALVFLGRSIRIATLTLIAAPAFLLRRFAGPLAGPRLLRRYLQSCGGTFVKLGQILAMRYDLLPGAYCQELGRLFDRLPPVPSERIVAVVETDLGRPVEACFASFDPIPMASASIAQVHGVVLHSGEAAVAKVMRPGVEARFRIDLGWLRLAGWSLGRYGMLANIDLGGIVAELVQLTREELDFRREARSAQRMHQLMESDEVDHCAPEVHLPLSGRRVITMERLEGVPLNRLIGDDEPAEEVALAVGAVDRVRAARTLMRSILVQSIRHRTFHADPHPANLILMPGGTLGWVDFGMSGWLDERAWAQQLAMRKAISEERIHAAYESLLLILEPLPEQDLGRFESEVKEYLREWIEASKDPAATLAEKSSGFFFLRTFDAIRRLGARMPMGVMRLYRSILIADMVMLRLDPAMDWLPVLRDFIAGERRRRTAELAAETLWPSTLSSALEAAITAPRSLFELVEWAHQHLPGFGRTARYGLSRLEKVAHLTLRYARTVLLAATAVIVGSRVLAPRLGPASGWTDLGTAVGALWWPAVIAGFATVYFLTRMIHELDRHG